MLWGLQMPLPRKFALTLIFGLGGGICAISILRIVTLKRFNIEDFTYDLAKLAIWTDLEPTLGIINACLPIVRPVTQRLMNSTIYILSVLSSRTRVNSTEDPNKSKDVNKFVKMNNIRAKPFDPIDETYHLTNISDGFTVSHIGGPHHSESKPGSLRSDLEAQVAAPTDSIDVKKYWKVDTEPLRA